MLWERVKCPSSIGEGTPSRPHSEIVPFVPVGYPHDGWVSCNEDNPWPS